MIEYYILIWIKFKLNQQFLLLQTKSAPKSFMHLNLTLIKDDKGVLFVSFQQQTIVDNLSLWMPTQFI